MPYVNPTDLAVADGNTTVRLYTGPDGTYFDVLPAPADAPEGAVLLNVSGCVFGIVQDVVIKLVDMLAEHKPGHGLHVGLGSDDDGTVFDVTISEDGADLRISREDSTHQVSIPAERCFGVASSIAVAGGGCDV